MQSIRLFYAFLLTIALGGATAFADSITALADAFFKGYPEYAMRDIRRMAFDRPFITADEHKEMFDRYLEKMMDQPFADQSKQRSAWLRHDGFGLQDLLITDAESRLVLNGIDDAQTIPFVEKKVIPAGSKVLVLGDLHGSAHSLLRSLVRMVKQGHLRDDFTLAPDRYLLVLGDITDRGCYGIEVVYLLLKLKLANFDRVWLVRGNHEGVLITQQYGFAVELGRKWPARTAGRIYNAFIAFCRTLPLAIFLGVQVPGVEKPIFMQCCHGGVEPFYDPNELLCADAKVSFERVEREEIPASFLATRHGASITKSSRGRKHIVGDGFQWSDVTGMAAWGATRRELFRGLAHPKTKGVQWLLNDARGAIGFRPNLEELDAYLAERSLVKMLRGHQDDRCCVKLTEAGVHDPVDWHDHTLYRETVRDRAATEGLLFKDMPACITMSTAAEARGNSYDGYALLDTTGAYHEWRYFIYESHLVGAHAMYRDGGYVKINSMDDTTGALDFTWVRDGTQAGVADATA